MATCSGVFACIQMRAPSVPRQDGLFDEGTRAGGIMRRQINLPTVRGSRLPGAAPVRTQKAVNSGPVFAKILNLATPHNNIAASRSWRQAQAHQHQPADCGAAILLEGDITA